jgi:hypothetical protein
MSDDNYERNPGQKAKIKSIMLKCVLPLVLITGLAVGGYFVYKRVLTPNEPVPLTEES